MMTNAASVATKAAVSAIAPWECVDRVAEVLTPGGLICAYVATTTQLGRTVETIRALLGKVPLFGICLGHQLLSLAGGARTYKLKFGHRGANHPVRDHATGAIEITSQNHGFAIDEKSLDDTPFMATHTNLNDFTNAGIASEELRAFGVQYHPEAAPGPHDAHHLFLRFRRLISGERVPADA